MLIDVKNLKEMHVPHVPLLEYDERFYAVPNATDYSQPSGWLFSL